MLIVQKMWKQSLSQFEYHYKILSCMFLIYFNKCKMQFVNNSFNILKVNGSSLIIEDMWKKSWFHFNINVGFLIVTYVLIDYAIPK
jgi:hypothetical protein